jgi:hypothetical protein
MHRRGALASWLAAVVLVGMAGQARALAFDFEGPANGTVIDQFTVDSLTLDITTQNVGGGPNLGIVFDSTLRGTRDPDLEFAKAGILKQGNVYIIQENSTGCSQVGDICTHPDDEGSRPAGSFTLDFSLGLVEFGLDLLDIEGPEEMGSFQFFVMQGQSFVQVGPTVDFEDLTNPMSLFYDPTIEFGDNSANRVLPFLAADFGSDRFDRVAINMGGSGAIDNLNVAVVPEPATLALVAMGLVGLVLSGRRPC